MAKKPTGSKQRQTARPGVADETRKPNEEAATDAVVDASSPTEAALVDESANAAASREPIGDDSGKESPPETRKASKARSPRKASARKRTPAPEPGVEVTPEDDSDAPDPTPASLAQAPAASDATKIQDPQETAASHEPDLEASEQAPMAEHPEDASPASMSPELAWETPEESSPSEPAAMEAQPQEPEVEPIQTQEPEPAPEPPLYQAPSRPSLFIVHITPEMASVAKVGGLADVVFGLTRELAIRGNHVETILPKYASMRYDQIYGLHEVYKDLWVPWYQGAIHCTVYFGFVHGRKCFFIEPHSQDNFFNRHGIYGFKDDILRYAFFSRAAMEFLWKSGKHPDIIHCHDWQTALVPVFLYEFYQALGMTHPRVCLTIHNFAHQGVTGNELLNATGLHRPERFFDQTRMGDNRHRNALNMLKGGIVYSNFVTTVSPRYAFETKDQGQGFGLEPTLHAHHIKYGGVVNGIDYDVWNPEIDHHIPVQYGLDSIERKYDDKRALRHRLMLADNEKAIVAFIGRLDPQKGLDLVRHAIFYTLERGAQFVLLGSSPDERINADFWGLKRMLNDSPDCHLEIGFDEDLSHLIYAGADMMLVPSRFEPCGLTQLIALRYGTIPVVRAVGGLADTVFDKDHSQRPLHERNGYVFKDYDNRGLESALGRAIDCYDDFPEHFRELMKNAMRSDYSWNIPGQDYLNIYDYIRDV
ncbi:glycogen synthase GlgA [Imhoffiella purpurea]|uniref:Glycogen synthase n=1 Tax=Imhoffiella purpurea TaxID=1249627 RepID=W9VVZ0_9GAMM|nr:glycogen synthase GlgA [Imhoffiella purpurea]EXJ14635.1 Glycogen synthase, ADP-glucose transglucosylase [Imhoffiella purpurea]